VGCLVGLGAVALVALFCLYGYWEAGQIEVAESELFFEALPPAFDGFRIIHLSCLHTRGFGRVERRLRRLLEGIDADLLVMAGDFKAHLSTPPEPVHASLDRIFAGLDYPWGMVACPGNHDVGGFYPQLAARGRFTCLLRNSLLVEKDGEAIVLLGGATARPLGGRGAHEIDECSWVGNVARRTAPWRLLPDGKARPLTCHRVSAGKLFRILVAHTPDFLLDAQADGIELVLAGDTHGGQIRLPFVGGLYIKTRLGRKYDRGHFVEGRTQMYVNPGIGTQYIPIRFLCRPEITVLTLRRTDGATSRAQAAPTPPDRWLTGAEPRPRRGPAGPDERGQR